MYAAMDIFVLASTCDEAFGMVLIEAWAHAQTGHRHNGRRYSVDY